MILYNPIILFPIYNKVPRNDYYYYYYLNIRSGPAAYQEQI